MHKLPKFLQSLNRGAARLPYRQQTKGKIYAEQGEDQAEFAEGDSFSWNACTPHLVRNISEETAIVLISIYTESDHTEEFLM